MSDTTFFLLCIGCPIGVLFLLILGISGSHTSNNSIRLNKQLREQVRVDYETARGTTHLQLLTPAEIKLREQLESIQSRLHQNKVALTQVSAQREKELRQALTRQLVQTELPTLPGIGPRLSNAVIAHVFEGELDDLKNAVLVDGIGPQKQARIDDWVMTQKHQLAVLLEADFPNKNKISQRYIQESNRLAEQIATDEALLRVRSALHNQVVQEILRLKQITQRDFELALTDLTKPADKIAHYILGVFPPWEPMPNWFAEAINLKTNNNGDTSDLGIHVFEF